MNTQKMTHRLYKDEYNAEFLYQLEHDQIDGLMATDESTEKVLVICGTLEDLQKLSSLMYENDEQKIKSVFPSFITKADLEKGLQLKPIIRIVHITAGLVTFYRHKSGCDHLK